MSGIKADIENHHLSPEVMLAYKKGTLSPQEMHKVERLLLEDEFAAEAIECLTTMDESRQDQNLQDLQIRLKQRIKKASKSYYLWYAAAAALLLLMVSVFVIFSFQEIKDKQLTEKENPKIAPEQIASAPSSSSSVTGGGENEVQQQQLMSNDIITENKNLPSSGHLSKPKTAPENTDKKDSQPEDIPVIANLDSISGISPAVAQAMAEKKEETIELKSSQPPPLAGKPSRSPEHRIVGQVLSAENGKGISGVDIEIKGTTLATRTDRQGNFSIPSTPGSTITFNRDGYYKEELKIKDQKTVNITLDEVNNTRSSISSTEAEDASAVTRKKPSEASASAPAKESSSVGENKMQKFRVELENEVAKMNLKDLPIAIVLNFEIKEDSLLDNFAFSPTLTERQKEVIISITKKTYPHFFDTSQATKIQIELKFKK